MKINKSIVFYFGIGGILPVIYFIGEGIYRGLYDPTTSEFYVDLFRNILISYGMVTSISWVVLLSIELVDKLFPWQKNIWGRFAADALITPAIAVIAVIPLAALTYLIYNQYDTFQVHMIKNVVITIVMDLILVAVYEGVYFFKQWKRSLLKTEQLEKEFLSSKFEALKNQINPHFLFNSLNTLSALIHEDVDKSEKFIDEFAKIYRYVLENQENIAVSLNNELAFVKSYLYLQQIRFGKSLDSEIKIDVSKLDYMIPTLSLQLLIENAIKHNKITKSDPLKIKIYNEEDYLVVENNLQLRDQKNDSTGIGLNNLKERYKLMTENSPEFVVTKKSYVAKIPLIKEI
jgi:two-component system LytT family sensor kinase